MRDYLGIFDYEKTDEYIIEAPILSALVIITISTQYDKSLKNVISYHT